MQSVDIHEAKTFLPLDAPEPSPPTRLGFLAEQIQVPEDFDTMGSTELEQRFGGGTSQEDQSGLDSS